MNIIIILLSCILLFFIVLYIVAKRGQLPPPCVGDLVFIAGPFDADRGWVNGMQSAVHARGYVLSVERDHYLVKLESGQQWTFSAPELVVL